MSPLPKKLNPSRLNPLSRKFLIPPENFSTPPPRKFRNPPPPRKFLHPPPKIFQSPPENFSIPPPENFSTPPENFSTPPPKISQPPTKIFQPLDNFSTPPENISNPTRKNINPKNMLRGNPPPPPQRWINHSTPGTIRPPELCYFKHEYEAGVGRRFSCYNRICHDVGGRACGGVSVLVRDGTTHSQIDHP